MRIGFVLAHLEADDGAFLVAVARAGRALDRVGLPVVGARVVEPERGEVEELLLRLPLALALVGLQERGLLADEAFAVALLGLADADEDAAAGVGDVHPERGRLAGRDRGPRLGAERRDAVLGRRRGRAREGERGDATGERERP